MLGHSGLSSAFWTVDNWGANPSATPGTSVVPGASNALGSWTQLLSGAAVANDIMGFRLQVTNGATAAQSKQHLIDIGIDPAGGTSYTAIISNLACGGSGAVTNGAALQWFFPLRIRAGASVAARVRGSNATAGTVRVAIRGYGKLSRPEVMPVGSYTETLGYTAGTLGTSFTPGNAADGSWASLGTTTKHLWWWNVGVQIDNATQSAHYTYIDLAHGDASNKTIIDRFQIHSTTGEVLNQSLVGHLHPFNTYVPVPAGSNIYIRGRNSAAPVTGYNATVVGVGG